MENCKLLGLYVHIPWCIRKCPYCDFNSHERHSIDEPGYVKQLMTDLTKELGRTTDSIKTIYFGGGTPSLFKPQSFEHVLSHPDLQSAEEITMEANPGALEHDRFEEYRDAGINRISIGIQSFQSEHLAVLGRIHSADEARYAVQSALDAGIPHVNGDLMFGLPNQSIKQALDDLLELIALGPSHISWYQLTIEPNTVFGKHPPLLASDDFRAEMGDRGTELLQKHGYDRYEVSAFCRDGDMCQHNVNYWRFGDYIGIGAGAHGKLSDEDGVLRTTKKRQPESYLRDCAPKDSPVPATALPVEFMMNALRLREGVERPLYRERTGLPFETIATTVNELVEQELMDAERLQLTSWAYERLDALVGRFV